MAHKISTKVFLSLILAEEHQKNIRLSHSPYSESYALGIVKTMVKLEDGSLVSGWVSKYETYSG